MAQGQFLQTFEEQNPYYDPRQAPVPVPQESTAAQNWIPMPQEAPAQPTQPAQPSMESEYGGSGPQGGIESRLSSLIENKSSPEPKPSGFQSFISHPVTQGVLKAIAAGGFGLVGQGPQFLAHLQQMQERDLDRQAAQWGLQGFSKVFQLTAQGKLAEAQGLADHVMAHPVYGQRIGKVVPHLMDRFTKMYGDQQDRQATATVAAGLQSGKPFNELMTDPNFVDALSKTPAGRTQGLLSLQERSGFHQGEQERKGAYVEDTIRHRGVAEGQRQESIDLRGRLVDSNIQHQRASEGQAERRLDQGDQRIAQQATKQQGGADELTPEARAMAAKNLLESGQMIPGMARNQKAVAGVLNEAARMDPEAASKLAGTRQDYKANSLSLSNLQKLTDAVQSFKGTLDKNLDMLSDLSAKVDRTGTPLANRGLIWLKQNTGDPNVSAFMVGLQSVQAETARVMNSATLAGVLSDSARHELQQTLNAAQTPAQLRAAIATIRREIGNREQSYQDRLDVIRGRVDKSANKPQPGAQAPTIDRDQLLKDLATEGARLRGGR